MANYFSKPHLSVRIWVCRLSLILFALMLVTESGNAQSTLPKSPVPLPSPFTPVVDNAHVIDPETKQRLGSIYENLKQ